MREIRDIATKVLIGIVNKTTGNSLSTYKTPYCAVVINKHHGFKKGYFTDEAAAVSWIYLSHNAINIYKITTFINVCDEEYSIDINSLRKITKQELKEIAVYVSSLYQGINMGYKTLSSVIMDLLTLNHKKVISVRVIDFTGASLTILMK